MSTLKKIIDMSTLKKIAEANNFTAVDFGKLADLPNGKAFLKEHTNSTGTEISLSVLPPKTDLPIFHTHKQNEETYIIVSGKGKFQVDDKVFDIQEGSVVRVAPAGDRGMTNTSDQPMVYIVVQSKENSLEQYTMEDGVITETKPKW